MSVIGIALGDICCYFEIFPFLTNNSLYLAENTRECHRTLIGTRMRSIKLRGIDNYFSVLESAFH